MVPLVRWLRVAAGRVLLTRRLRRALPAEVGELMRSLAGAGLSAALVGGAVRDLLLGRKPKDWDIAAGTGMEELQHLFPDGKPMGGGQTLLVVRGGQPYELTPFRGAALAEDLAHRDFTVNGMALVIGRWDGAGRPHSVRLIDPQGGAGDLAAGVLQACGERRGLIRAAGPGRVDGDQGYVWARERLAEDPLRALRAVRIAAALGLEMEPGLIRALGEVGRGGLRLPADSVDGRGTADPDGGRGVAAERIGAELERLLVSGRPAWGMERLRELGLLGPVAPELLEMVGVEQNEFHAFPVWEHAMLALALTPPDPVLRWAALLHDVGKPRTVSADGEGRRHFYGHEHVGAEMAEALLERLRLPGEMRRRVVHLVRYHMDLHLDGEVGDGAIRRMIRRVGLESLGDLLQLRRADRLASGKRSGDLSAETVALVQQIESVLAAEAALKVTDLAVDGRDVLAAFGRPPGPYVGEVLERLLDEVIDQPCRNRRDGLLARLAELSKL